MTDYEHGNRSSEIRSGKSEGIQVRDAPFPHIDIEPEGDDRNPDRVPPAPEGPLIGTLDPTADPTKLGDISGGGAGEGVVFHTDTPFGDLVSGGDPPDMSGASSENVVLATGNTYAVLSTDGGNTFTLLDPTTIFPSGPTFDAGGNLLAGGLCCDQVIQYAPEFDLFIWFMQFTATGPGPLQGINKLRIAAATAEEVRSSGGTAWTYWDFFSADFGQTVVLDYPDMLIGHSMLNVSIDAVGVGFLVFRIPLAELAAGGTVNFGFTNPSDSAVAYGGHVSQNTGDTVFWAGHNSTSQLRVFAWPEASGSYSWVDIDINSWLNTDYSSKAPDGTDWLQFMAGFPGDGIIGATRRNGPAGSELWLAWTAARGGGFAHPHIQVVELDTGSWSVINQWQIWNPDIAFAYPCLATNRDEEVGISLGWGGNTDFGNFAVGMLGDFIVWFSEASDAALTRWGDYVTCRPAGRPRLFDGTGYSVLQNAPPATGTRYNPRYTLFGRP